MMRLADAEFNYARESGRHRVAKLSLIVIAHALALYALTRETIQTRIAKVISAQIISIDLPTPKPVIEPSRELKPQKRIAETPMQKSARAAPSEPTASTESATAEPQIAVAELARDSSAIDVVAKTPIATATPSLPTPTTPPPQSQTKIELPSSNADYLTNPTPPYPPQSKRLGEQGRVLLRVYVSEEGLPRAIELMQSCGYERLDEIALATVKKWKFVPGKRNGVAEAMWVNVPVVFELA
jgi:periplasmic protein TonB